MAIEESGARTRPWRSKRGAAPMKSGGEGRDRGLAASTARVRAFERLAGLRPHRFRPGVVERARRGRETISGFRQAVEECIAYLAREAGPKASFPRCRYPRRQFRHGVARPRTRFGPGSTAPTGAALRGLAPGLSIVEHGYPTRPITALSGGNKKKVMLEEDGARPRV